MDKRPSRLIGPKGEGYVVVQFILFAIIAFGPRTLPGWAEWQPPWSTIGRIGGTALGIAGAALLLAGLFSLGGNLTAVPRPKEQAQLVQSGAYRIVRHPIYSGLILGAFGLGLLRNGFLTLVYAALLFLLFDLKSRVEEMWLTEKYDAYRAYQQRVRKLIPFIY